MRTNVSSDRDRVNILLVDDRYENLLALSAILNDPEYNLVLARSGVQALRALLKSEFAVAILDVMMPEMDGYQVATLIKNRELTKHLSIIFLTAIAGDIEHIFKGYSVGAVDYLMKPLEPAIVRAKVAVFVDLFKSKQQIKEQSDALREIESQAQQARFALQRQENEAWYSITLRSIADAVITTDVQGLVQFLNPVAEALTGWSCFDAHGKSIECVFKIINEETKNEVKNLNEILFQSSKQMGFEDHALLVNRNKKEFAVEINRTPIRSEVNTSLGAVITFRDITEKRREIKRHKFVSMASAILLSTLDFGSTLTSVARLAISSVTDCCVVVFSPDLKSSHDIIVAHSSDEVEKRILKIANRIKRRDDRSLIDRLASVEKVEFIPRICDEHLRVFSDDMDGIELLKKLNLKSCICAPFTGQGKFFGAILLLSESSRPDASSEDVRMVEDLALRISGAIENARLYDEAQKSIQLRDEFLSVASHELRTPITPLKLQLQSMMKFVSEKTFAAETVKKMERMLVIANRQMERFQKLVEELLDVSRISAGKLNLEKESVDLASVVGETVGHFEDELRKVNCSVKVHTVPTVGHWDRLRVEQVLINLLANAAKYGAGKPIEIDVENDGVVAWLKVQDHGPGIKKEDQRRIFDRFERGPNQQLVPGLGLGLYISRQILEAHGGSIEVKSEPNQGATFIVELPLNVGQDKVTLREVA